jgi:hypothetical protein
MLQTPTGTPQMAGRTASGPDSTVPVPSYPQPVLTQASLQAWQETPGLTDAETEERGKVAIEILRLAIPSVREGTLADSLDVVGDLTVRDYRHLAQLPAGLHVSGSLDCSRCISLTQLPEGLSVGGNLVCNGCARLTLPAKLNLGGHLSCNDCPSVIRLPDDITSWGPLANGRERVINLFGSGLSFDLLKRLGEAEAPGMYIRFDRALAAHPHLYFANLNTAAKFWSEKTLGLTTLKLGAWTDVSIDNCELLIKFLDRLCRSPDYQHPGARWRLAGRVCDLLQAMDESPALRQLCSNRISNALQTGGDSVIWTMSQVEKFMHVQRHPLRQQEAKQWSWERMVPKPWPQGLKAEDLRCAFTLQDFGSLAQPVLAPTGSTWRAYEAHALLTYWVEHGTDPFHQTLKLADLQRPAMSVGD